MTIFQMFDFGRGSALDPAGGAHSAPPDLLAGFKGPTSKGRGGQGRAGEGKGRKGEAGGGRGDGSIFIQIFVVGSEKRIFSAIKCVSAIQGHPRSLILAPIESAYATSYYSLIVTLVLSWTVSEIRRRIG